MSAQLEHISTRLQAELAAAVDEPTYRIWLAPLQLREATREHLVLEAPPRAAGWVRERFGRLLQTCAAAVLGPAIVVDVVASEHPTSVSRTTELAQHAGDARRVRGARNSANASVQRSNGRGSGAGSHSTTTPHDDGPSPTELLANPRLTFEHFVIGDCNRLAHAAALTVAEMPSHAYNPLFVCGPPGVGKTHLLRAIAALITSYNPGLVVRIATGEAFTNEFLDALTDGSLERFKSRFRRVDALLIDDVQFLERKARTEEEFFHTFNSLHDSGAQLVLTSDRPPQDLQALEDRLRERFEAGLVAEVSPPDFNTRLAILCKRAHQDGVELADDDALALIAERVTLNVRALEGALIRVVAYASLTGRELTGELTRAVLDNLYPSAQQQSRSVADIQAAACTQFGLSQDELVSTSRTARIAGPRQLAMYLARELTDESLPAIGRLFGGRDHTTVLHAWRRTGERIASDDATRSAVDALRARITEHT